MKPSYNSLLELVVNGKLDAFECGRHVVAYRDEGDIDKMDGNTFHGLTVLEAVEGNIAAALNFFKVILEEEEWVLTVEFGGNATISRRNYSYETVVKVEDGNDAEAIVIAVLTARTVYGR